MKTNKQYGLMFEILILGLMFSGCDSGISAMQAASAEGISAIANPAADQPAVPLQPVLVSEPVSIIIPEADAALPEAEIAHDVDLSDVAPVIVGSIDSTDSTPAVQIIESAPVVAVISEPVREVASVVESEPVVETPILVETSTSSPTQDAPAVIADPAAADAVVMQPLPAPIAAIADAVPIAGDDADTITADVDADEDVRGSEEEADVKLEGSCFKKKRVGFVWYHKNHFAKKKTVSMKCKNGKYKARIKIKRKFLSLVKFQTLFFD